MYIIEVKTDKNLGDEGFVRSLLTDWYHNINPKLRPERFGQGEPVRKKFEDEGVEAAIRLWLKDKLPLMLKKISSPKFEVEISGYQAMITEAKQFPSDCTVWLDRRAGDDLAIEFLKFLIDQFEPGFGFVSTENDQKEKHYITAESEIGRIEEYVGLDVGKKLPGVYWITYFSRWAINKVGPDKFETLNIYDMIEYQNGYLLVVYKDSANIGSVNARNAETTIIEKLGKESFFDKSSVNIGELSKL